MTTKDTMTSGQIFSSYKKALLKECFEEEEIVGKQWLSKAYSDSLVALERKRYKEFVMKCIDESKTCLCRNDKHSSSCVHIVIIKQLKQKLEQK